jgi:hypothetical protein
MDLSCTFRSTWIYGFFVGYWGPAYSEWGVPILKQPELKGALF